VWWTGDTNGCAVVDNVVTAAMTQARSITAVFAIDTKTLSVVSAQGGQDPATLTTNYGTVLSCAVTNSPAPGGAGTQYVCQGWTLTGNEPASGATTNFTLTLTNNATLTWNWQTEYQLTTATNGSGSVTAADGWYASGSNVTLTATQSANWHFVWWTGDTGGCAVVDNVVTAAMTQARSITAVFSIDTKTLSVVSAAGGQDPATLTTNYGTVLSCAVTNSPAPGGVGTQYVCQGWTMTGNEPAGGATTNFTLTLTNNATLTWNWQTEYQLTTATNGSGSVTAADGWYASGSNVTLTATQSANWHFVWWTGDTGGCAVVDNVVTAAMTQARSITANFAVTLAPLGTPEWWLALYGLTNQTPAQEEMLDRDGDGMAAWKEYRADTIPSNSDSVLLITRIQKQAGGFLIEWKGGVLATQVLERSSQLTGTGVTWNALLTNSPPTSTLTNYLDTTAIGSNAFFRIRIE
jgi:NOL1/NOP2/fmu family ribosome biogenesis protein